MWAQSLQSAADGCIDWLPVDSPVCSDNQYEKKQSCRMANSPRDTMLYKAVAVEVHMRSEAQAPAGHSTETRFINTQKLPEGAFTSRRLDLRARIPNRRETQLKNRIDHLWWKLQFGGKGISGLQWPWPLTLMLHPSPSKKKVINGSSNPKPFTHPIYPQFHSESRVLDLSRWVLPESK